MSSPIPPAQPSRIRPWGSAVISVLAAVLVAALLPSTTQAQVVEESTSGDPVVQRIAGDDRVATAVAVSQAAFDHAPAAVLATAGDFADALVGASVAAGVGGPLLLTTPEAVPAIVATELQRLGVTDVILLGGEVAISTGAFTQLASTYDVRRVAGPTRFDTARAASREAADPSRVFLASGDSFADALSVAPLAAFAGNPVLLTATDTLPAQVEQGLLDLGPAEIVLVGGTAAVGPAVEASVNDLAPTVRRLAGPTRWDTSVAVYDEAVDAGMDPTGAWLATSSDFPDALAAGAAAAATAETFLLVPGADVLGHPGTAERLMAAACDLRRVVLLGGPAAISAAATDQLSALLDVNCDALDPADEPDEDGEGDDPDADGDTPPADSPPTTTPPGGSPPGGSPPGGTPPGDTPPSEDPLPDETGPMCLEPEFSLSELLATLDPDGDPDGDGFTNGQERGALSFDPVADTARFNPFIADVPELGLTINDDVTVDLTGSIGGSVVNESATITEDERTDTEQDIDTREVTESHEASVGAGGSASGLSVEAGYTYTNSTTSTTGTITTREEREFNSEAFRQAFEAYENIEGGELRFTVRVANTGHVDFRLDDIAINVSRLTASGDRVPLGVADAAPAATLLEGDVGTFQLLLPLNSPIVAQGMGRDVSGLDLEISTFTLTEIGRGDIRTDSNDFSQYQQRIRQNTAAVDLDFGPVGGIEGHLVSTTFRRNADETPRGTKLCQVLTTLLGRNVQTVVDELDFGSGPEEVDVLTGLSTRIGTVDQDFVEDPSRNAYWIAAVQSLSVGQPLPFGLSEVLLRAGESTRLVLYADADDDGLPHSREARDLGTSDDLVDSDGDGIDDPVEISAPWDVSVTNFGRVAGDDRTHPAQPDPTSPDRDGDGWDDPTEQSNGTDPVLADTDGDAVADPDDIDPLDGGTGAELLTPLAYWPLDEFNADLQSSFPDEAPGADGTFDLDACTNGAAGLRAGQIADRANLADGAFAVGQANGVDNKGCALRVGSPESFTPAFNGQWTVAAWVGPLDFDGVLAGQPDYMAITLASDGITVAPAGGRDGESDPDLPDAVVVDFDFAEQRWYHVAVSATEQPGGAVQIIVYVDGQQIGDEVVPDADLQNSSECRFVLGMHLMQCPGDTDGDVWGSGFDELGTIANDDGTDASGIDDVYVFGDVLTADQVLELATLPTSTQPAA